MTTDLSYLLSIIYYYLFIEFVFIFIFINTFSNIHFSRRVDLA